MFLINWISGAFSWVVDKFTTSDEERVRAAYESVERTIIESQQLKGWLKESGWRATGGDGVSAMRKSTTRDAAVFGIIEGFYELGDDPAKMLARLKAQGLDNGSSTHSYILNSGEGSIGRSDSNHTAALVVDESAQPPTVTLAFRGMNPASDWQSPTGGLWDTFWGNKAKGCQKEADTFWDGAKGDIARIMREVASRNGGKMPKVVVAGHSYGSDAAARMVPKFIGAFPETRDSIDLVGYGAIQTFTRAERDQIFELLGKDNKRARQYMTRDDIIQDLGFGYIVGEKRSIPIDAGHVHYEDKATDVAALQEALRELMEKDPKHAEERAKRLVEAYKREPDSVLRELAAYTSAPPAAGVATATGAQTTMRI